MRTPRPPARFLLSSCLIPLLVPATLRAAAVAWDEGGASGDWATAANWNPDTTLASLDTLTFGASTITALNNNTTANNTYGLTFSAAAPAYTIGGNGITLNNTTVLNSAAVTQTLATPLVLAGTVNFNNAANAASGFELSGNISGSGGIRKNNGVNNTLFTKLVLSGANNTFTGGVTINSGIIEIRNSQSLGSGTKTVTMTSGTNGRPSLHLNPSSGNIDLPATMSWATSTSSNANTGFRNLAGDNVIRGNFNITSGGGDTQFIVDAGTLTLTGTMSFGSASRSIVVTGAGNGTLAGNIVFNNFATTGLRKTGTGVWTVSGTGNTYAGNTAVDGGTLRLGAANVIPNGTAKGNVTFNTASSATLDLNGFSETINGLSNTGAGAAIVDNTAAGAVTLTVGDNAATTTFNGVIQDTGGNLSLTKVGNGTLTLGGSANTFAGIVTVNDGVLSVTNGGALGSSAKTLVLAGDAATDRTPELRVQGGITIAVNQLHSSGTGFGPGSGVIRNISGDNTITAAGGIVLRSGNGSSTWQSDAGTLTLNGNIAPNVTGRALVLAGAGNGVVNGSVNNGAGANTLAGLLKTGAGTWTLAADTNGHTSNTTVSGGTLALSAANQNNLASSPVIEVQSGATLDVTGLVGGAFATAAGQTVKGAGRVAGGLIVDLNAIVSPGASPGTLTVDNQLTLGAGGTYRFELDLVDTANVSQDALKGLNDGHDFVSVGGGMLSNATPVNPFTVEVVSLQAIDTPGAVSNWDPNLNYTWRLATSALNFSLFNPAAYSVDTSAFTSHNSTPGDFFVTADGNNLFLNYAVVPEPGTAALFALGLASLLRGVRGKR